MPSMIRDSSIDARLIESTLGIDSPWFSTIKKYFHFRFDMKTFLAVKKFDTPSRICLLYLFFKLRDGISLIFQFKLGGIVFLNCISPTTSARLDLVN